MAALALLVATLLNVFSRGVSETFAVFLLPLTNEFGWERASLTSVYAVFMVANGVSAPVVGMLFDRAGPRWCYGLGLLAYGAGYCLAAQAETRAALLWSVGLLGGFGTAAIGMVPASALISRWYRQRLTSAMGVAYAGLGLGVLLVVPLTQVLIDEGGWRYAYRSLGLALLALLVVVVLLPWRRLSAGAASELASARTDSKRREWHLSDAWRTTGFWACFGVFFLTSVAVYAVAPQVVAYWVEIGFDPLMAASAFGLTSALAVIGMIGVGSLADRYGRREVITVTYGFTISGIVVLLLMWVIPSPYLLGAFVIVFGIVQGSRGPVVFALAARLFPGRGLGAIYGAITLGMGIGAAFGAWVSGWLHDRTEGYVASFTLGIVAALTAVVLIWTVPALSDHNRRR